TLLQTGDIACHEIKGSFKVKDLIAPSGGAWGSYYIDKAFEFMLIKIFDSDDMNEFKAISFRQGEYNNSKSNNSLRLQDWQTTTQVPQTSPYQSSFDIFMQGKYEDIEQVINDFQFNGKPCQIQYIGTGLWMSHNVWMKMFDDLLDLINTNAELLKHKLKCIFLVGGFSQSEYLRKRIADEFAAIITSSFQGIPFCELAKYPTLSSPGSSIRHTESVTPSNVLKATNSGVSADYIQNHKFTISNSREF
ncbi:hypothetical protein RFI_30318, partial [Reticulomyxa filosa]